MILSLGNIVVKIKIYWLPVLNLVNLCTQQSVISQTESGLGKIIL